MSRLRRLAVPGALAVAATAACPAGTAWAESTPAVERTAWFSAASGGGLAAPQPGTAEGDLRVARAAQTQAFGTLLYRGEGARAALDLQLRDGAGAGTPEVVACPTVAADWADGGNQPMDAAPEVDCARALAYGILSEDGLTLSFGLDSAFEVEPGTWSIALVPAPSAVVAGPPPKAPLPFTTDLQRPEIGAFVLTEAFSLPVTPDPVSEAPPDDGATTGGSGTAVSDGFAALPADSGSAPAAALDPAVAPPVAPPAASSPLPVTLAQPVVLRQAAQAGDDDAGRRLLALLALAGGSAAVGYAAGQQRPGPRLIGGRAGLGAPAAVAATTAPGTDRPRGIGRFARERDGAPRRLR